MTALAERTNGPAGAVPAPTVSVVICCYTMQRWQLLLRAVDSVRRQDVAAHELVIVVDHSPDLLDLVRSELPDVDVVANHYGRGLSGARNTGIEWARGEVVAFLDDDAAADRTWLRETVAAYTDDRVLGVGGRVVPQWVGGRPRWFPAEFDWVVGCSYLGQPTARTPVRNFIGANMSFRRDILVQAGGFSEQLGRVGDRPFGCEETELCIRVAERWPDGTLVYNPAATVRHHVPKERSLWSYFRARCFAEGRSKAAVAELAGTSRALRSERAYVRTVLPAGVGAAVRGAVREPAALGRASAIVLGLLITTSGFLTGQVRRSRPGLRRWRLLTALGPLRGRQLAATAPLVAALALWALSLRHVALGTMNDLGLVSVLPIPYWAALMTLVAAIVVLAQRGIARDRLIACYVVALVLVLHATPTILYGSLRYSWAWKHIGIVDYVMRHGGVDPNIAQLPVYHAWPGFFTLNAFLTQAGGLASPLSYAAWAPPVFELLALAPLILLFRTFTTDRRRVWIAVLVYYLTAWVGQDYFSPQAFSFFLYLVVLVVALRLLGATPTRRGGQLQPAERVRRLLHGGAIDRETLSPASRRALCVAVVLMMLAIASSHQLTPIMLTVALGVLVAVRVSGPRWLPWVMAAITVAWILWLGRTYVSANMQSIVRAFGALMSNTQNGFVNLQDASVGQQVVDWTDRLLTALVWPAAAAGFWRQWRYGRQETVPVLLALVPVPMLAANDYGGEILFRVCLFALPFLAFLISGLFQAPEPGAAVEYAAVSADAGPQCKVVRQRPRPVATLVACLVLAPMFLIAYDGKERMNYFSPSERAASTWLYDTAPRGSLITSINSNYPWAFVHYEYYDYDFLEYLPPAQRAALVTRPAAVLERFLAAGCDRPAYLVLTRSQDVEVRYTASLDPRSVPQISRAVRNDPYFRLVYGNRDASIYEVDPSACVAADRSGP